MDLPAPALDLHPWCHDSGGDVAGALHAARVFLLGQLAMGSPEVHIIHGKGAGKLRDLIRTLLEEYRQQKLVLDFYVLATNNGVTVIKLPTGRKAREALKEDPAGLRTRPFELLSENLRKQLDKPLPPPQAPEVPLPVIDGETRLGTQQFATLEEYARALVRQRTEEATPPSAAPRRLKKSASAQTSSPVAPVRDGWAERELDDLAKEARGLQTPPSAQRKTPGR